MLLLAVASENNPNPSDFYYFRDKRKSNYKKKSGTRKNPEGYIYTGTESFTLKNGTVVNPGDRVSSRQYANIKYVKLGFKSKAQYEYYRKKSFRDPKFKALVNSSDTDIPEKELRVLYGLAAKDKYKDLTPSGPFAGFLVALGLRDPSDEWNVGETNTPKAK